MQNHDTTTRYMHARAAMGGAAKAMQETHEGQAAILSILLDESHELNEYQRNGLLVALQGLNDRIGHRASFLMSCMDEHIAGDE